MLRNHMRLAWLFVLLLCDIGCSPSMKSENLSNSPHWDGTVKQWGTLREVMHGEIMDGQVKLAQVTDKPHVYGIGAPDKLHGEILIADSVAWVSHVTGGEQIRTRVSDSASDSAVFLAVAEVPRWTDVTVNRDVPADKFDDFIQETLGGAGLEDVDIVPFTIEGKYSALELHVLNGQCPFADVKVQLEGAGPPHRMSLENVTGLLVGFYSDNGAGRITHHWTRTHVHALIGTAEELHKQQPVAAGHVDAVALTKGTVIRLPQLDSQPPTGPNAR